MVCQLAMRGSAKGDVPESGGERACQVDEMATKVIVRVVIIIVM